MAAYYNEIDPFAVEWLRNLIREGHIAAGDVDTRDIRDVRPVDVAGYDQCHFFAGIGIWSYALRVIGWPDDRPIWTGSCPCQPFSGAGKGLGFDDERHLWPDWYWLIDQCRPERIVGEQVTGAAVGPWIDLVFADLEAIGYACGSTVLPACGVGAPNRRERTWWLADADMRRREPGREGSATVGHGQAAGPDRGVGSVADVAVSRRHEQPQRDDRADGRPASEPGRLLPAGSLGDAGGARLPLRQLDDVFGTGRWPKGRAVEQPGVSPVSGYWSNAEWLACRDGRHRPVEPGIFPLADGVAGRVGRLRAYGNAINAEAAIAFLRACFAA